MRHAGLFLLLALAQLGAGPVRANTPGVTLVSALAPSVWGASAPDVGTHVLRGAHEVPELWLAQRAIERDWGLSEDSTYRTVEVKGWRSEGLALALSAALPGAGELYIGERSGWLFVAGEALGWVGRTITRRRGNDLREQAAVFVGDPTDSVSTWSFARYESVSGSAADRLEALWAADRESFYQALATDPAYRAGFDGTDPGVAYESYRGLRESSQDRFRQSRLLEIALWANHAVSAFDALRAARIHNLPIRRTIDLQLGARMRRGQPVLRATLVRRF